MKGAVAIFLIFNVWTIVTAQINWCNLCNNHIACNNPGNLDPSCPADTQIVSLTADDRNAVLNAHNTFRNNFAAGRVGTFQTAAKMNRVFWDNDLAFLAGLNVRQCQMRHDACRDTPNFRGAGQNLFQSWTTGNFPTVATSLSSAVTSWSNEYRDATQADLNTCCGGTNFPRIGHFLQVVQDEARFIGCAVARFTRDGWRQTLIACNYSRGNFLGTPVYLTGAVGSRCANGVDGTFTSLCR